MKTTKIYSYILMLAAALMMTACHSSKSATATTTSEQTWHDVYMPVKVKLNSPMSMSMSGKATLVRDSLVHLSMRVLGMEVAVVNATPDSLILVDKYHKYVFAESMDKIMGSHKLTLADVQEIMLGIKSNAPLNQLSFNNPGSDKPVVATFTDFLATPAGNIAQTVTINATLKNSDVEAQLLWSADDASWNTNRSVNFTTPVKGYKRITVENVLNMFKTM